MALNAGKMSFVVSASAGQLFAGLSRASASVKAFGSVAGQVAASVGAAFGGLSAVGIGQWALGLAANLQQTQQQFSILIGNSQQAASVLGELRKFDIVSPLGLQSLLDASRTLLGFGMAASDVVPVIKMLGDVSMGNQERFAGLALVMGQVAAAGRMTGQDLLQFINAGFNPLQQIAQKTGETLEQVRERMSAGSVSANEIRQALVDATSAGGRFAGMIEAAGQTVGGRFQMLKGRVEAMATALGETMLPAATSVVGIMESIVTAIDTFDGRTLLAATQMMAFVGTFALVIRYSGAVVSAFRAIITSIQAMTTAQAVFQAFSGPKGWAQLAIATVAAAGAVIAVEQAFAGVADTAAKASGQSEAAIKKTEEAAKAAAKSVTDGKKAVTESAGIVQRHIAAETQARNELRAAIQSGNVAAAKAAKASLEALQEQNSLELQQAIAGIAKKYDEATLAAERHAKMLERGQQVAEQFATPEQAFANTAQELNDLAAAGAISGDVFDRAFGDATNKLLEARMEAAGLNQELQGVGAAAAGTMEGFRAMAEARRGMEQSQARAAEAAIVQQQIAAMTPQREQGGFSAEMRDILRTQRDILQDILQETKSKEAFTVGTVELY